MQTTHLSQLAAVFDKITDPRHKRGIRHPFAGLLALVLLGTLAGMTEIAVIQRWAKKHWKELQIPLGFKRKTPAATTISRSLAQYSVSELQDSLAEFFNVILAEENAPLVAAVDGKTACQTRDDEGHPVHMLNVFVHNVRVTIAQWSVRGDKTNEPGCLKNHAAELFKQYPLLQLLTGDAIFAQRPLIEVLREHGCDYLSRSGQTCRCEKTLLQVRDNQHDTLEAVKFHFREALKIPLTSCNLRLQCLNYRVSRYINAVKK